MGKEDFKDKIRELVVYILPSPDCDDSDIVENYVDSFMLGVSEYTANLESQLKNKDRELKDFKGLFKSAQKGHKNQIEMAERGKELFENAMKLVEEIQSTMYSEEQLKKAHRNGALCEASGGFEYRFNKIDYPTYKEEQEDNA